MQYRADNHCARVYIEIEQTINHNDFDTYIIIVIT